MSMTGKPPDETEGFDSGPLEILFSGPARTRVLEAFVSERGRDLTVSDVARLSDTARSSVYRHLENLQDLGIIVETRTTGEGHSTRYQLNEDSDIAELLYQLEGTTLRRLLELDGHHVE